MANPVLIIITVIFLLLLIVASLYLLVYFQHEEDKNTAIFPKIIVVISFTLTCVNVLMLPLDVANTNGGRNDGGFPMGDLWLAVYIITGILCVAVIPFAIFYYEAEDPTEDNIDQIKTAIIWSFGTIIVFAIIVVILYLTLGVAQVPVTKLNADWQSRDNYVDCTNCQEFPNEIIEYRVSVILYIVSMLTFVGVFLFMLFGGIGLAALPIDLLWGFKRRPQLMKKEEYDAGRTTVAARVAVLLERGKRLQDRFKITGGRPKSRRDRRNYNQFRADVFLLEEEWNRLDKSYNKGIGPKLAVILWGWAQLPLGFGAAILSIMWVLHVIIYEVLRPPPTSFLNVMFIELDSAFGLFGTVAYAVFAFYLLLCVIKGNFKFGLRIPFIFSIHPMKPKETLMNSFLFNCLLLLLSSLAVVQFCTSAFSQYSRFTGIDAIFNVGVRNLAGIKYVYYYYFWVWFLLGFITAGFLIAFPDRKKRKKKDKNADLDLA
eukprot:TRINITY_DN8753_c0_g1_i1.p1 TRINITY_DN8753_c0_g1~~TRINITY_DN8753_c0_g1_i1.p1  ORF type:complete len:487 (+),score=146.87 TRINITY_DN8753_c0_g1_i1:127-1587(+)